MRRQLTAILCGCAVLWLTGCGAAAPATSGEPSRGQTMDLAPKEGDIRYEAALEEVSGESREGDVRLLTYRYEVPVLRAYRADGSELTGEAGGDPEERALRTVETFNESFRYWRDGQDAQEVESWAREDYAAMKDILPIWTEGRGYETQLTCELYQTEGFVSARGMYYSFTGGAHPNTVYVAWNFDLESGSFVEPGFLAADAQAFQEAVKEEIIRQAEAIAEENGQEPGVYFWEEYRDIAAAWADYTVSFGEEGMTVTFAPYEMGCYAVGTQEFLLDRDFLRQYLSPEGLRLLGYEE